MKKIILTDRTRMTTFMECPRKAFWNFYWGGTGIVPNEEALPLLFGSAVHITFERLLVADTTIDSAVAQGNTCFDSLPEPLRSEQKWLFECLIRIWATTRMPALRREFDFLAVEKELLWRLGEDDSRVVLQMVRPDLLARRVVDGELFYIEWKTTAYGEEEWAKKWEKNTQVFCNALAIEETLGEKVAGVMIEGLVKGPRKKEWRVSSRFKGELLQQSPLCYGWVSGGKLDTKWSYGAEHIPLWTISGMTPEGLVSTADPTKFLCPVPPISPSREDVEDWREGAFWQMVRIAEGIEALEQAEGKDKRKIVSRYFPPNFEACYAYRRQCEYFGPCFDPGVRKNILSSGFSPRTPHHDAEKPGTTIAEDDTK